MGHMGGASIGRGYPKTRNPRLEPGGSGAPSPNRLSVHFHARGFYFFLLNFIFLLLVFLSPF